MAIHDTKGGHLISVITAVDGQWATCVKCKAVGPPTLHWFDRYCGPCEGEPPENTGPMQADPRAGNDWGPGASGRSI